MNNYTKRFQKTQEPNVVWSTNPEYLNIMLQEKTKESLLSKSISHSACELAFIKRQLLREDSNKDEVLEIVNNFIYEKKEQVSLLKELGEMK